MEIINILEKMKKDLENENNFFIKMKDVYKNWEPQLDFYNKNIIENLKKITALNIAILLLKSNEKSN